MDLITPCQQAFLERLRLYYPQARVTMEELRDAFVERRGDNPETESHWHSDFLDLATMLLADLGDDEGVAVTAQKELVLIHLRAALEAATLGRQMMETRKREAGNDLPNLRPVAGRRPTGALPPPLLRQVSQSHGVPSADDSPQGGDFADEEARIRALEGTTVRHRSSRLTATVVQALPRGIGSNTTPLLLVKPGVRHLAHWPLHDTESVATSEAAASLP